MKTALISSFVFLIFYVASVFIGHIQAALFFFGLSPVIVIWLVYKVLKDPKEVKVTFEDEFYQDGSHPRTKS